MSREFQQASGRTVDDSASAARNLLERMFRAAVDHADAFRAVTANLPEPPKGRCVVVGAGKAAARMALAAEAAWPDVDLSGVVVTPYGYGAPLKRIRLMEARHPIPDAASEAAGRALLDAVRGLEPDALVLAFISGGGSSVLAAPVAGVTLEDKQAVNAALLRSGLDIRSMNAVRRRLSAVKGGRLSAAAAPAQVLSLAISDVPGDEPSVIASGPTVPDPDAEADLTWILDRLPGWSPGPAVRDLLARGRPLPTQPERSEFRLVATPLAALEAAATLARAEGYTVVNLGDRLEGEARELGAALAARALEPVTAPTVFLSGGETTVSMTDGQGGQGGRNTEFLLSCAIRLNGARGVWALAADTDGVDGDNEGAAGAVAGPDTLVRAAELGMRPESFLSAHDSGGFFRALGDLLVVGPTGTNVNDFRAIVVTPG